MDKLIALHEVHRDNGKGYIRLERRMDDGCAPHVLAPWSPVANRREAERYAKREGAELEVIHVYT